MFQFIINLFNKNKFEYQKLKNFNQYSFEELKSEIEYINPSIEIKIIKNDINVITLFILFIINIKLINIIVFNLDRYLYQIGY